MADDTKTEKKSGSGWLNVAVDYGPLLVFFLAYKYYAPEDAARDPAGELLAVVYSTGAFVISAVIALATSKMLLGRVSPMLWLSTSMIVVFGALTIYFQDERFIQWKPTIIYALFAVILLVGAMRGRSLLKVLLEAAFEGLTDEGWLKLSRNWGIFFVFLAGLNTTLIYLTQVNVITFATWISLKLWLFLPLTFLFTFTQVPMLLRHGLSVEDEAEVVKDEPPTA
ncbi:MAG: septation protein IspZ [Erythrobacter sp.]|nr:septation protein IspZ [Erythrobacter sp.]